MTKVFSIVLAAMAGLTLVGCKIVFEQEGEAVVVAEGPEGDDARNAQRIEETFEAQLLPHIQGNAVPVGELRTLIADDLDAAGQAHANRGAGAGAAWNFLVSGEGLVTEAKLDTRARTASVDTDGDGTADVTLQLGPVIRGTALRDAAPFYSFDNFRDQIEFAKLSRALNDEVVARLDVPEQDLIGQTVAFVGVAPLRSASEAMVVTPTELRFQP